MNLRRSGRTAWACGAAIGLLAGLVSASFGSNVWNVGGGKATEEKAQATGGSFFKASGAVYLMLGHMQEQKYDEAKTFLELAQTEFGKARNGCEDIRKEGPKDQVVVQRLSAVSTRLGEKRRVFLATGAIPSQDAEWSKVAGFAEGKNFDGLLKMCAASIDGATKALGIVGGRVAGRSVAPQSEVWILMNVVEQGLLQARYVSILFTP